MKIIRVKKTKVYDVFLGNGWANHSRVIVKDGQVFYKEGRKLSSIECVEIAKTTGK